MTHQFLSSELTAFENNQDRAKFHIVPMPLEKTVSYGSGTHKGPAAILEASDQLERLCQGKQPAMQGIYTEAAVDCSGDIKTCLANLRKRTKEIIARGGLPVTLGGEHSVSYGAVMGVMDALQKPIGIIHIDAHADMRDAYQGEPHSHASVMHLLLKEGVKIAQFGIRALCPEEQDMRDAYGVFYHDAEELVTRGIDKIDLPKDFPGNVYISFDVDGLDPSIMPATGTPVPGGLGYYQSLRLIEHALQGRTCVGMDIVELAPLEGQPAWDFTAAQIIYRLMAACI